MGKTDRIEEEELLDIDEWIRLYQDKDLTLENEYTTHNIKYLNEGDWI